MVKSLISYVLPPELIAQNPLPDRSSSRLLVMNRNASTLQHRHFFELPRFLKRGDCLVLNDTRVIPARLHGKRLTGGAVELLLLRRGEEKSSFWCLTRPAGKFRVNSRILFGQELSGAVVELGEGPERLIRFEAQGDIDQKLQSLGEIPLPPYIRRPPTAEDEHQYQTVYAKQEGAVAAPTAGLHFTKELLKQLEQAGVNIAYVTLHVGPGTFRPPTEKELESGRLHAEWFNMPEETTRTLNQTKASGGRIIAVGTTTCRVLETVARCEGIFSPAALSGPSGPSGLKARPRSSRLWLRQKDAAPWPAGLRRDTGPLGLRIAVENTPSQRISSRSGWTNLFIQPGFEFLVVDALITNFHLPETSLLSLVAAFAREDSVLNAYETAVRMRYRFYSYGDAMFIQ